MSILQKNTFFICKKKFICQYVQKKYKVVSDVCLVFDFKKNKKKIDHYRVTTIDSNKKFSQIILFISFSYESDISEILKEVFSKCENEFFYGKTYSISLRPSNQILINKLLNELIWEVCKSKFVHTMYLINCSPTYKTYEIVINIIKKIKDESIKEDSIQDTSTKLQKLYEQSKVEIAKRDKTILNLKSKLEKFKKHNMINLIKTLQTTIKNRSKFDKILEIPLKELIAQKDENGNHKIIGKGGFGIVKEYSFKNQMIVAVKEIPVVGLEEKIIEREVKIAKLCVYPSVVRVFGYTKLSKKEIGIVMEKIDGNPLSELVFEKKEKISNYEKWILIKLMTKTVDYLHSKKVIHRDIDPSNWLVTKKRRNIKLIDFGLSSIKTCTAKFSKVPMGGKCRFMAPEIIDDNKGINYGIKSVKDFFSNL